MNHMDFTPPPLPPLHRESFRFYDNDLGDKWGQFVLLIRDMHTQRKQVVWRDMVFYIQEVMVTLDRPPLSSYIDFALVEYRCFAARPRAGALQLEDLQPTDFLKAGEANG